MSFMQRPLCVFDHFDTFITLLLEKNYRVIGLLFSTENVLIFCIFFCCLRFTIDFKMLSTG